MKTSQNKNKSIGNCAHCHATKKRQRRDQARRDGVAFVVGNDAHLDAGMNFVQQNLKHRKLLVFAQKRNATTVRATGPTVPTGCRDVNRRVGRLNQLGKNIDAVIRREERRQAQRNAAQRSVAMISSVGLRLLEIKIKSMQKTTKIKVRDRWYRHQTPTTHAQTMQKETESAFLWRSGGSIF